MTFREKIAQSVFNFLDIGKSPHPSDCIFVPAGGQERKVYGIKMWRFGYAPQLILSVDRFEWRKLGELQLGADGGLETFAAQTLPDKQHFLIGRNLQETSCVPVRIGRLQIRSEARILAEYLTKMPVRSLLVVSSPVYLRRTSLAFHRAFRKSGIDLKFVAVPESLSMSSPVVRAGIYSELLKYLCYRIFL